MTSLFSLAASYFDRHEHKIVDRYKELLTYKTISADYLDHKNEFTHCVAWLKKWLLSMEFSVSVYERNDAPPVILAQKTFGRNDEKTPVLTIYNHYDVQPVDPIDEWKSPPFEPTIDASKTIWARGAQDNKGQLLYVLAAMEAMSALFTEESSPITVRLLIEGEEESGSSFLEQLIPEIEEHLKSDYSMIIDMGMEEVSTPAITFGARGLVGLTVSYVGSPIDLHSGMHGGLARNPLHALVEVLSSLRSSEDGRILIDGFYDDIVPINEKERASLYQLKESTWKNEHGIIPTGGEVAHSMTERNWLRPTLEINGIHGGYGGTGTKTVIPREAIAKITCRLVPDQDPEKVLQLVRRAIEERTPAGISCQITPSEGGGRAIRLNSSSPLADALSSAMKEVWNQEPHYVLSGGSIPILSLLHTALGGELVLWGTGLLSDAIHAPNEHFDLDRLKRGFLTTCLSVKKLSEIGRMRSTSRHSHKTARNIS